MPFQVNLDSSISVPILLVDTVSSSVFPKFALSQRGPPGKFYRGSYAVDLLGTLRTKGSFARVKLSPDATKVYGVNFGLFVKRLSDELVRVSFFGKFRNPDCYISLLRWLTKTCLHSALQPILCSLRD